MRVGLGTDVGGGAAFSMFRVMDEAYKTARLRGGTITPLELWHRATLGGAEALNLEDNIGNFVATKRPILRCLIFSPRPYWRGDFPFARRRRINFSPWPFGG